MRHRIVFDILRKELTETLRDRRTLLMMVALPVLIYPLLMIGFSKLQVSQQEATEERVSRVAVWGVESPGFLDAITKSGRVIVDRSVVPPDSVRRGLEQGTLARPAVPAGEKRGDPRERDGATAGVEPDHPVLAAARAAVSARHVDAVVVLWPDTAKALAELGVGSASIYYDSVLEDSLEAQSRLDRLVDAYRETLVSERERRLGLVAGFARGLDVRSTNVAQEARRSGQILGLFLPFILVTMSLLGGFYPAIDITAGEKERGTMQTLLCAPVSPLEIVTGKYLAVWVTSLIAALVNVVSLGTTVMRILPGESVSVSLPTLLMVFGMLLPVTLFITAVFLAVATFAKDFKDGQNFLTPVYMLLALPSAVTMLRGVELNAWTAFVPVVNIALLIKALLVSEAAPDLIFLALLSSTAWAGMAIMLAARVFAREQVLLGGRESLRSLLGFERKAGAVPTPGFVLSAFAFVLVLAFYGSLLLKSSGTIVTLLVTEYRVLPGAHAAACRRLRVRRQADARAPAALDRRARGRGAHRLVGVGGGRRPAHQGAAAARVARAGARAVAAARRGARAVVARLAGHRRHARDLRGTVLQGPDPVGAAAPRALAGAADVRPALRPGAQLGLPPGSHLFHRPAAVVVGVADRIDLDGHPGARAEQRHRRDARVSQAARGRPRGRHADVPGLAADAGRHPDARGRAGGAAPGAEEIGDCPL